MDLGPAPGPGHGHDTRTAAGRSGLGARRLAKELQTLKEKGVPAGCSLVKAEDLETWCVHSPRDWQQAPVVRAAIKKHGQAVEVIHPVPLAAVPRAAFVPSSLALPSSRQSSTADDADTVRPTQVHKHRTARRICLSGRYVHSLPPLLSHTVPPTNTGLGAPETITRPRPLVLICFLAAERYLLRFRFDNNYPMEAPEVVFVVSDGWKSPEREWKRPIRGLLSYVSHTSY